MPPTGDSSINSAVTSSPMRRQTMEQWRSAADRHQLCVHLIRHKQTPLLLGLGSCPIETHTSVINAPAPRPSPADPTTKPLTRAPPRCNGRRGRRPAQPRRRCDAQLKPGQRRSNNPGVTDIVPIADPRKPAPTPITPTSFEGQQVRQDLARMVAVTRPFTTGTALCSARWMTLSWAKVLTTMASTYEEKTRATSATGSLT